MSNAVTRIIAVITSDINGEGGISQFTQTFVNSVLDNGVDCILFSPEINSIPCSSHSFKFKVKLPVRIAISEIRKIEFQLKRFGINTVVFSSVGYCVDQIVKYLVRKGFSCYVCVHDVIPHGRKESFIRRIIGFIRQRSDLKSFKLAKGVIVLSPLSLKDFINVYGSQYESKLVLVTLGAHAPKSEEKKPQEMGEIGNFLLCFGRIEPYKDIKTIIESYSFLDNPSLKLVIAGSGFLDSASVELAAQNKNVFIINRFITSGEMVYLFKKCSAVILPYLSATQSGVLPLAYYYGKPVISSNVDNLSMYVEENKTGYIYKSKEELLKILASCELKELKEMEAECLAYCDDHFDFSKNVRSFLAKLDT